MNNEQNNQQNQNNQRNNNQNQHNQHNQQPKPEQPQQRHPEMSPEAPESQERNKKAMKGIGIALIIIVVVVLAASGKWFKSSDKTTTDQSLTTDTLPEGCSEGSLFSATTGKPCPSTPTTIGGDSMKADKPDTTETSGYDEAIKAYAGKMIAFDGDCKPAPASPEFAIGTRILVANNSEKTLILSASGRTETLDRYHYFTVTLPIGGMTDVSCNGAVAATVMVK